MLIDLDQINVNVTDTIPPDNYATVDVGIKVGTVYTKEQDNAWRKEVEQNTNAGIKGIAKPDDIIVTTGFYRMLADAAQTYTNYLDDNDAPIVVTADDLNIVNGVQRNEVIIEVTNGVAEKKVFAKVGADGANGTATIPQWVAGDYSPNAMVLKDLVQYIAPNGATATDVPGESSKWVLMERNEILLIKPYSQLLDAINAISPLNRREGIVVKYYDSEISGFRSFMYNSNSISGWQTLGNWQEINRAGQVYNLQGSYTLQSAISAIPNTERKSGLIISFQDSAAGNRVKSYEYVLASTGNWTNTLYWEEIVQKSALNAAILNQEKSNQILTLKGNASTYRMEYKNASDANIDGDFTLLLDYGFNSFPATTQYIISKGAHAFTHQGFSVSALGNRIMFKIKDRQVFYEFDLNVLNRYLFVKKGQIMYIYVNGLKTAELNTTIDLPTSNAYKLQVGLYSYNNAGLPLDGQFGSVGLINNADIDFVKIGDLRTIVDENTISWMAFLKPYLLLNTTISADLKGLPIQAYGTPSSYYISKSAQSSSDKTFNTFSQMYLTFPENAKVGKYTAFRNTDIKSGDVVKDYDIISNSQRTLNALKILEKRTLSNNIYSVDQYGICYGVRNNNIIIQSTDAGVTWTDLLTISTLNKISFVYCTNDGELLLLEDTYRDDVNLSNDRIGGIWKTSNNKTAASKVHILSNRYQTFQPSWSIEIVDNIIYFSEYGNSYNTTAFDPSWNKGSKADATRIWKSTNNGNSFTLLINLDTLTDLFPVNGGLHVHALHYDRFWDRLWVTTGDGGAAVKSNKKLIWTDDQLNWKGIDLSNYLNGGYQGAALSPYENLQGLSMISTNEYLLLGSDNWHNAIFRVNKRKKDDVSLEVACETSPITNDVVYFTGRMKKIDDLPILIQLGRGDAETTNAQNNQKPRILATYDGFKIKEVWSDLTVNTASDFTFQFFKIKGEYYFTYSNFIVKFYI